MENYELFKKRNAAFGGYGMPSDREMQRNYDIALNVEAAYHATHAKTDEPQIGDIVEFSDGFSVHKHAKIVEDVYRNDKRYGLMCVCENGSSWTNGISFSTSGGAFHTIHKSHFELVGTDENVVWTWGCNGAGANQGIYLTLKVRKWIIPYEPLKMRSIVNFVKNDKGKYEVGIQNFGDWFYEMHFDSVKKFLAWAEYAGYKHTHEGKGRMTRISPQRLCKHALCSKDDIPADGKPLKALSNGRIVDGWVRADENNVVTFTDNFSKESYVYRENETQKQQKLIAKYAGNPLGIK